VLVTGTILVADVLLAGMASADEIQFERNVADAATEKLVATRAR
jgi:hypothetical protein